MRPHALIVSPDTQADLRTTTHGAALQRIIARLQEYGIPYYIHLPYTPGG